MSGVAPGAALHLLRVLLGDEDRPAVLSDATWRELLPIAQRNGVLLRAVARLDGAAAARAALPPDVAAAVATERERADATVRTVRAVAAECAARGVPHVFISALQHLPDVGVDADLLVPEQAPGLDAALAAALQTTPLPRGLGARLSGAVTYPARGGAVPVDVHCGRLGVAGEHARYPAAILAAPRRLVLDGTPVPVPTADDQMVLQGIHRLYGRRHIRLGDVVATVALLRRESLDWDYVLARAEETGTGAGLSCYLRYVETVFRMAFGSALLDPRLATRLERASWGPVSLRSGVLRYPVLRVNAHLFPRVLARQLRSRDWRAAARLCLVPVVAAESSLRRVAQLGSRLGARIGARVGARVAAPAEA